MVDGDGYEVELEVTCVDSARREFDSIDELLSYENSDSARINELSIRSYPPYKNRQDECSADLKFSLDEKISGLLDHCAISLRLTGPDEKVVYTEKRIQEKLEGTKPWYSYVARINGFHVSFVVFVAVFVALLLSLALLTRSDILQLFSQEKGVAELLSYSVGAGIALFLFFWTPLSFASRWAIRFRRSVFPGGLFLIGQQADLEEARNHRRRRLVNWAWGTVAAGVLALVGLIWNAM